MIVAELQAYYQARGKTVFTFRGPLALGDALGTRSLLSIGRRTPTRLTGSEMSSRLLHYPPDLDVVSWGATPRVVERMVIFALPCSTI